MDETLEMMKAVRSEFRKMDRSCEAPHPLLTGQPHTPINHSELGDIENSVLRCRLCSQGSELNESSNKCCHGSFEKNGM